MTNAGQPGERRLVLDTVIPAPVARVWQAWTTREGLAGWWWNHWPDVDIEVDARVGGAYRFAVPTAGIVVSGTYLAVEERSRLAFTWKWADADGRSVAEVVDVRFAEEGAATRVFIVHSGPWTDDAPGESYRQGWTFVLAALAAREKCA
jgi:uncharacterized protein YndB with AHSA1/START domain